MAVLMQQNFGVWQ